MRPASQAIGSRYEAGMKISFDMASGVVTVWFRGRIVMLEKLYPSEPAAMRAGESYCRAQGWAGEPPQRTDTPRRWITSTRRRPR